MLALSNATLAGLSPRISIPTYDRRELRPSIVHIGVGAFHRSHQAMYLDAIARAGSTQWAEIGVGFRSPKMRSRLRPQDCLFTVLERTQPERAQVVGVMTDYLFAPESPAAVLDVLSDPRTRVVSLSVTGDGYATKPDAAGSPAWYAYVTEALARRRAEGTSGFTVLSCDNLRDNGTAARRAILDCATRRDADLAAWITDNVSFPNAMVDRITPQPDSRLHTYVANKFGVVDRACVQTEGFTQWVLEDDFGQGRPPFEEVGVQMVADVRPYKLVKMRLLNGVHSAIAYLGFLAGFTTAAEVVRDQRMRTFVESMMRDEIAPLLPRPRGMDVSQYIDTVLNRLSDEQVGDTLSRLCARGSTKVPAYLLPSLIEARREGRPTPLLTLAVAGWFRYLRGTDLAGRSIDIEDKHVAKLRERAREGGIDPSPLLALTSVMGDLGRDVGANQDIRVALMEIDDNLFAAVDRHLRRSALTRRHQVRQHRQPARDGLTA